MSDLRLIVNDNGQLLHHTEETLDEWFRSLSGEDKVRLYQAEHEIATLNAMDLYDEMLHARFDTTVTGLVSRIDAAERLFCARQPKEASA